MIFFSHVIINFAVASGGGGEESSGVERRGWKKANITIL